MRSLKSLCSQSDNKERPLPSLTYFVKLVINHSLAIITDINVNCTVNVAAKLTEQGINRAFFWENFLRVEFQNKTQKGMI